MPWQAWHKGCPSVSGQEVPIKVPTEDFCKSSCSGDSQKLRQRPLMPLVLRGAGNQRWQRHFCAEIFCLGLALAVMQMGAAHQHCCSCTRALEVWELRWVILKEGHPIMNIFWVFPVSFQNWSHTLWCRGLVCSCFGAAMAWEQLKGRYSSRSWPSRWDSSHWNSEKHGHLQLLERHECCAHLSFDRLNFPLEGVFSFHGQWNKLEEVLILSA